MGKCPLLVKMFGRGPGDCRSDCEWMLTTSNGFQRCALATIGELAAEKLEKVYRDEVMSGSKRSRFSIVE